MKEECHRICLTPARNENWIIRPFLAAAKTWADHVIVADQRSSDGTLEELRTAGVSVVVNDATIFDETQRQELLLKTAREIHGKRILMGLDADEALSANCHDNPEWKRIEDASPGTVLRFRWVNLLPGMEQAWIPQGHRPFGFVDDGRQHNGKRIHSPRVPCPPNAPVIDFDEVVVLHFQYLAWERMVSKHRWYQAWEHETHGQKHPLQIFREYHHMYGSWDADEIFPVRSEWLQAYDNAGIDFRSLVTEPMTWWDQEVCEMLRRRGPRYFSKIAIWDKDWNAVANRMGLGDVHLNDPRNAFDRLVHEFLMRTQGRRTDVSVRIFEQVLRLLGW